MPVRAGAAASGPALAGEEQSQAGPPAVALLENLPGETAVAVPAGPRLTALLHRSASALALDREG